MATLGGGAQRPPTALLYCHDTFGLGHLRRTLAVAGELQRRRPDVSQLVATGSPIAHAFRLPDGVDYLKLPAVAKTGADRYRARSLPLDFTELSRLRRALLTAAAHHLAPDLVVVDNVPGGLAGELVPALRALRRGGTRLVLGLRDVVDDPAIVRRAWTRDGCYELLDDVFDRILVYGDAAVFDVVNAYGLSAAAAAKTRYVGYLRRELNGEVDAVRARLRLNGRRLVLVTAGGGEDGYAVLRAALDARLRGAAADAAWLVVTGPFLPAARRAELVDDAARVPETRVVEFEGDLPAVMAAADVVVSMAGYNSVCEILSARCRAIVIPRVEPRVEQLLRAQALERRALVRTVHPGELTPVVLARQLAAALADRGAAEPDVDLGGLERVGAELEELLAVRAATAAGARR